MEGSRGQGGKSTKGRRKEEFRWSCVWKGNEEQKQKSSAERKWEKESIFAEEGAGREGCESREIRSQVELRCVGARGSELH